METSADWGTESAPRAAAPQRGRLRAGTRAGTRAAPVLAEAWPFPKTTFHEGVVACASTRGAEVQVSTQVDSTGARIVRIRRLEFARSPRWSKPCGINVLSAGVSFSRWTELTPVG